MRIMLIMQISGRPCVAWSFCKLQPA